MAPWLRDDGMYCDCWSPAGDDLVHNRMNRCKINVPPPPVRKLVQHTDNMENSVGLAKTKNASEIDNLIMLVGVFN